MVSLREKYRILQALCIFLVVVTFLLISYILLFDIAEKQQIIFLLLIRDYIVASSQSIKLYHAPFFLTVMSPFVNFLILLLLGRFLGKNGSSFFSVLMLSFSFIGSLYLLVNYGFQNEIYVFHFARWIVTDFCELHWVFFF